VRALILDRLVQAARPDDDDDLIDAVLDGLPRSLRRSAREKRDRKWEVTLAYRNCDAAGLKSP
jgi:hypothetical protein